MPFRDCHSAVMWLASTEVSVLLTLVRLNTKTKLLNWAKQNENIVNLLWWWQWCLVSNESISGLFSAVSRLVVRSVKVETLHMTVCLFVCLCSVYTSGIWTWEAFIRYELQHLLDMLMKLICCLYSTLWHCIKDCMLTQLCLVSL